MRFTHANTRSRQRHGVVLLVVLFVLVMLSLAAYQFSELMTAEAKAADSYTRSAQARALANSGIHYAAVLLSNKDAFTNQLNSNPLDNTQAFQGQVVTPDEEKRTGRFSILAPLSPDDAGTQSQPYRFGVTDETGKINLNAFLQLDSSGQILHDMLVQLPNMTEDIANSMIDYIDADDEPRSNGAENDYYSSQNPPYQAKNGPLDTVEELLFVKGVTPRLLLGNDRNRNGILEPDEDDDGTGVLDQGWAAYLTVYSREQNIDSQGNPRVYVNDSDLDGLYTKLSNVVGQDLANYIIAYRTYGPAANTTSGSGTGTNSGGGPSATGSGGTSATGGGSSANSGTAVMATTRTATGATASVVTPAPAAGAGAASTTGARTSTAGTSGGASGGAAGGTATGGGAGTARLTRAAIGSSPQGQGQRIASLYELVNSRVSIPSSTPGGQPTVYASPMSSPDTIRQFLPQVLDELTTVRNTELPARINVNTAPQAVLTALPGISPADVQNIISHRPSPSSTDAPDPIFQTPAWLITEANMDPQKLRSLERYITARSQVYRVQSLGYFDGGGPTARIEAVIDTNNGRPRILYWRDLTELGKGYDLQSNP